MINPTVCMPTMWDNSLCMKLSVILQTGSSFDLTEEVAVAYCRSRPYAYSFTNKPVLDLERWKYWDNHLSYHHFRLLPAIMHVQRTVVSPAISRCRVHTVSFVSPFWRSNDVSIFCNHEVISRPNSGFASMLTLTVENMLPIFALVVVLISIKFSDLELCSYR